MVLAWFRRRSWFVCKLALLWALMAALSGFGGFAQPVAPYLEPQSVGPVTNLAATVDGQPPGSVQLTWTAAENAQVHFVVYIKATDAASGNFGAVQMASFSGTEAVIHGLEGGTPYAFIALGMRWNWIEYGTIWGDWSQWVFAIPTGQAPSQPPFQSPPTEPNAVGRVSNLTVGHAGEPGTVRATWSPGQNAQVHFVVYIKSHDGASGNYGTAQMVPFAGSQGVIRGLEGGTAYDFIVIGMRWNWVNYGAVWGEWSAWVSTDIGGSADPSDRSALVALYDATDGLNWSNNANWLSSRPLGEWYGVTTDAAGSVSKISLVQNQLSGPIPDELGDLSNLTELYLGHNRLDAQIPPALGRLSNLIGLNLRENQLSGEIPSELGNLHNLESLDLAGNLLTGCVPAGLQDVTYNDFAELGLPFCGTVVPDIPDLAIEAFSVSWLEDSSGGPAGSLATGGLFQLSATVVNRGIGVAPATTLRYLQDGVEIESQPVRSLGAAQEESVYADLTAPSEPGIYRFDICVDPVLGEPNTANNCASGINIRILASETIAPDLVIADVTSAGLLSSPLYEYGGRIQAGQTFFLFASVHNQGNGPSEATTLRYYRDRAEVDSEPVAPLPASQGVDVTISLTAPTQAGVYRYWSCVDAVVGESDTQNNCSVVSEIEVQGGPDFTVTSPSVSNNNPLPGDYITFLATVENQGSSRSTSTDLRVYRSRDRAITTRDTQVAVIGMSGFDAGRSRSESVRIRAPSDAGTYYYGACVDPVHLESDTANNCSDAVTVTISGRPDLVVRSVSVSNPAPQPGTEFTLNATVYNQGTGPSERADLTYYRSTDRRIEVSDTPVGSDRVSALDPRRKDDESTGVTAPSGAGIYHYGACVASVALESDTTNNCSSAETITVSAPTRPDLIVRLPEIDNDRPAPGSSITVIYQIWNQGDADSGPIQATAYRSRDRNIGPNDEFIATLDIRNIAAGRGLDWVRINQVVPTAPGTYYYGACVNAVSGESNTRNNCSTGAAITVVEPPDLVLNIFLGGSGPEYVGSTSSVAAEVYNVGQGSAGSSATVRFYRSTNRIFSIGNQIGTRDFRPPAPSGDVRRTLGYTVPHYEDLSTIYYAACVDSVPGESDTTNNCTSWIGTFVFHPVIIYEYDCSEEYFLTVPLGTKIEGTVFARLAVRQANVRWKAIDSFGRTLADRTVRLGSMSAGDSEDFDDSAGRYALFDHCEVTMEWVY